MDQKTCYFVLQELLRLFHVQDTDSQTEPVRPSLTLEDLPPEVRFKIFSYCVDWPVRIFSEDHEMPALVVALRQHRPLDMYLEALSIVYRQNLFKIKQPSRNEAKVGCHPATSQIRKLTVCFDFRDESSDREAGLPYEIWVPYLLSCATNLQCLHLNRSAIEMACRPKGDMAWPLDQSGLVIFLSAVHGLKNLQRVTLEFWPEFLTPEKRRHIDPRNYNLIAALNALFGVVGLPVLVITREWKFGSDSVMDTWVWQSEQGRVLGGVYGYPNLDDNTNPDDNDSEDDSTGSSSDYLIPIAGIPS